MFAPILLLFAGLSMALEIDGLIGASPVSPLIQPNQLIPRAKIDLACVSKVVEKTFPTEGPNPLFNSWVLSASPEMPACTVTVPASFSSDYLNHDKVISTFASTITSALKEAKYTCGDPFTVSFTDHYCSTSRTVFFTAKGNKTESVVLPTMTNTNKIVLGAAGRAAASHSLGLLAFGTVLVALFL